MRVAAVKLPIPLKISLNTVILVIVNLQVVEVTATQLVVFRKVTSLLLYVRIV